MSRIFKSIGHGLLAAGFVLIALYFAAVSHSATRSTRSLREIISCSLHSYPEHCCFG
jgi:hypothetical protein